MLWVDASGLVLGPAKSFDEGFYVDANGNFWPVNRITGVVEPMANYIVVEQLFTGPNCSGSEIVAGTGPNMPMEVAGILREVPPTAPLVTTNPISQRLSNGSCVAAEHVYCDQWVACYLESDVANFPELTLPGPFAAPIHAEWQ